MAGINKVPRETVAMKHKKTLIFIFLVVLMLASFLVALDHFCVPTNQTLSPIGPFIGIETGWNSTLGDCQALIDKVKNYTNLFIIASPLIISNESLLNQTCDYAYNAGMYFMPVYFQDFNFDTGIGYTPSLWFSTAKERYGNQLLGLYYYDEPGGSQLDLTEIIPNPVLTSTPKSYLDYSNYYFWLWSHGAGGVKTTADFMRNSGSSLFTSDYALYWFDYELGYDTVLAQFGWNNSRQLQISLIRGAANVQNKLWGAIITWTYNQPPYLESGAQMYNDMVLAYNSGASYIAVYDSSQNYTSTTLNQDHFDALKNFWNYVQHNPDKHGNLKADKAVVLLQDYGFGFRSPTDSVWQDHQVDNWTQKMYTDVTNLINQYNSSVDIVYGDPQFQSSVQTKYCKILHWPRDFETDISYRVTNINNGLGYSSIQDAVSSFATYEGATISVKPGKYQENIVITKPVSLTSQNKDTTITDNLQNNPLLTISSDNVTITGFVVQNNGNFSGGAGEGIILDSAHNCSLIKNTVTNCYTGIFINNSSNNILKNNIIDNNYFGVVLQNSSENTLRGNSFNKNTYNFVGQNAFPNDIDSSNIVNGKPYITD
jgi:parallel beta-helix repeat protein